MNIVKVGDRVRWRGAFGMAAATVATVEGIEDTGAKGSYRAKYGQPVESIDLDTRQGVVDLDTGNWAYTEQIEPL
jgi:hypothetical protein